MRRRPAPDAAARDEGDASVAIALTAVRKRFGDTPVIEELDLRVIGGELLVLLGPSGSGKTTMLNVIAGLEEPDGGTVHFGERDVTGTPPEDRDVAVVFQNYSLYPHLDVRQNVTFPLRIRGVSDQLISQRLASVATMLGIDHLLKRRINELSGGQRQRVAIAKALVKRPEVFLLDEPFSALDAVVRRQLRSELVQLHAELKTTMIFVTHDQDEAMSIADRIAVMREGRIVQIGSPLDIYNDPADLWVAGFIGAQAINVVPVSVEGEDLRLFGPDGRTMTAPVGVGERLREAQQHGDVVIGVRPELVQVGHGGDEQAGRVATRQIHGTSILYEIEVAGGSLRAVVPSLPGIDVFAPGDAVSFDFLWAGVFAFEAGSGRRIALTS